MSYYFGQTVRFGEKIPAMKLHHYKGTQKTCMTKPLMKDMYRLVATQIAIPLDLEPLP
jgi:hypothetical protein